MLQIVASLMIIIDDTSWGYDTPGITSILTYDCHNMFIVQDRAFGTSNSFETQAADKTQLFVKKNKFID